jgi:hypothetical protein
MNDMQIQGAIWVAACALLSIYLTRRRRRRVR